MENQKSNKGIILLLVIIILILVALLGLFITKTNSSSLESNQTKTENETNINTDNNVSSTENIVTQKSSVSKSQIASYYKDKLSIFNDSNHQYSIIDINNDNIPELFIYVTGTIGNEIVANTNIYTYDENKGEASNNYIVDVGIIDGRLDHNTVFYKMNDGRLLSLYGYRGYEKATYFKLENDWLVRTEFSSRQTENYMTGDIEIEFKPCSDTSLIDNYN